MPDRGLVPSPRILHLDPTASGLIFSWPLKIYSPRRPGGRRSRRAVGLLQRRTMSDDELWHVRVSADEVKQLTLEQIDDLYRLDVIDADTQLWQDGMAEWLPLRVVA